MEGTIIVYIAPPEADRLKRIDIAVLKGEPFIDIIGTSHRPPSEAPEMDWWKEDEILAIGRLVGQIGIAVRSSSLENLDSWFQRWLTNRDITYVSRQEGELSLTDATWAEKICLNP